MWIPHVFRFNSTMIARRFDVTYLLVRIKNNFLFKNFLQKDFSIRSIPSTETKQKMYKHGQDSGKGEQEWKPVTFCFDRYTVFYNLKATSQESPVSTFPWDMIKTFAYCLNKYLRRAVTSKFMLHASDFTLHSTDFIVRSSHFKAHGSCLPLHSLDQSKHFIVYTSHFMIHTSEFIIHCS